MALPLHTLSSSQHSTPMEEEEEQQQQQQTHGINSNNESRNNKSSSISKNQIAAMISNLSTSYNTTNIALVLPILHCLLQTSSSSSSKDGLIASSLLAGMIFGQIAGGTLGDVLGRKKALVVVILLQMVASIGSASVPLSKKSVDVALVIWRFVLGVGAGGVYPLAAVLSAESYSPNSNNNDDEEDGKKNRKEKLKSVALTFSTQGIGFLLVPLVTFLLLLICGEERLNLVWRIVLALGALPGLVLFVMLCWDCCRAFKCCKQQQQQQQHNQATTTLSLSRQQQHDDDDDDDDVTRSSLQLGNNNKQDQYHEPLLLHPHQTNDDARSFYTAQTTAASMQLHSHSHQPSSSSSSTTTTTTGLWQSIKSEPQLLRKLCGTAGTWFLFDVLFYGNTLFQPVVLQAAFHHSNNNNNSTQQQEYHDLIITARDALLLSLLALPGYFVTAFLVGSHTNILLPCSRKKIHQTPKYIQIQGFVCMCILYTLIGTLWNTLTSSSSNNNNNPLLLQWTLLFLYGGTFFFANYGPNATTFMLPSITYSKKCRSTLNGVSAAAGKLGALVGALAFEDLVNWCGGDDGGVMLICAGICVLGVVLTCVCVLEYKEEEEEEEEEEDDGRDEEENKDCVSSNDDDDDDDAYLLLQGEEEDTRQD